MEHLNTVVRVMYGTGDERGLALVIGACEAPQLLLQAPDGERFWWRQDLCRGAKESAGLEAAYWKSRADAAERKLAARDGIAALVDFKTAKQAGVIAGDGKPCPNDHDPNCGWPQCNCRQRGQ